MHYGVTSNAGLLVNVPLDVVTLTGPVIAPAGTVAFSSVSLKTLKFAGVPLNQTPEVPVSPWPRISTPHPTLPDPCTKLTNGPSPTDRLKTVPQGVELMEPGQLELLLPPFPVVP